jgi:hypothetical protein
MATTTNYSWVTPDDTSLVKDGASAIRTLGSSIDTTTKNLNPSTTLGDIEYRSSTANTNTRLALGTAGQVLTVNSGATAPEWAAAPSSIPESATATVATAQDSSSTSYTDLTTAGPAVTVTTGTKALVIVTTSFQNSAGSVQNYFMDFAVSGATTRSASDATAVKFLPANSGQQMRASAATLVTLTAGSNTFTAKYRVGAASTCQWKDRTIFVLNLA